VRKLNLECFTHNNNFEIRTMGTLKCLLKTELRKGQEKIGLYIKHDGEYIIELPHFSVNIQSVGDKENTQGNSWMLPILLIVCLYIIFFGRNFPNLEFVRWHVIISEIFS